MCELPVEATWQGAGREMVTAVLHVQRKEVREPRGARHALEENWSLAPTLISAQ